MYRARANYGQAASACKSFLICYCSRDVVNIDTPFTEIRMVQVKYFSRNATFPNIAFRPCTLFTLHFAKENLAYACFIFPSCQHEIIDGYTNFVFRLCRP